MAKRRRRGMGAVERKERAFVVTGLPCEGPGRKILQSALRLSRPRTTCHDIVVECLGPAGDRHSRLAVRADCTSSKTRDQFTAMAEGYAESVKDMLK